MNKIIPILSLIFSALCALAAVLGIILCCVAVSVPQFKLVAVPTAIVGAVCSALGTGLNILFRKSKLCRIALYIDACALALSAAAIIVWLCAI